MRKKAESKNGEAALDRGAAAAAKEEIARHHQLIVNNWVGDAPSLGSYAELWDAPERFDPCCVLSMRTAAQLVEALRARVDTLNDELAAAADVAPGG